MCSKDSCIDHWYTSLQVTRHEKVHDYEFLTTYKVSFEFDSIVNYLLISDRVAVVPHMHTSKGYHFFSSLKR